MCPWDQGMGWDEPGRARPDRGDPKAERWDTHHLAALGFTRAGWEDQGNLLTWPPPKSLADSGAGKVEGYHPAHLSGLCCHRG